MVPEPGNTLSRAKQIAIVPKGSVLREEIGKTDRRDIYQFHQIGRSSFNLRLNKLKANASVALLNSQGKVIARSERPGKRSEQIRTTLGSGIYYVQVSSGRHRSTSYQLKLSAQPVISPLLTTNLSLVQGERVVLSRSMMNTLNMGRSTDELVYTLTRLPEAGRLELNGRPLQVNDQFTQADIDSERLSYTNTVRIKQLNQRNVRNFERSESTIVWEEFDGNDYEIYLYDDRINSITQLSNNQIDDKVETVADAGTVWQSVEGNISTFFFYNRLQGSTTQLTTDDDTSDFIRNRIASIANEGVVWERGEAIDPQEIFFYSSATNKTIPLTNAGTFQTVMNAKIFWQTGSFGSSQLQFYDIAKNTTVSISTVGSNSFGVVADTYVIWQSGSFFGGGNQIFLYDLTTGFNKPLTDRGDYRFVKDSNTKIVWQQFDGNDNELILYDKATNSTTQITNNDLNDTAKDWLESGLVWESFTMGFNRQKQLFFYHFPTSTSQPLSELGINEFKGISGTNAFWRSFDGSNNQLFSYNSKTATKLQLTENNTYNRADSTFDSIADANLTNTNIINPNITNVNAAWKAFDGSDHEIFFFDSNRNLVQKITDNQLDDSDAKIASTSILWQQFDGTDDEIILYNTINNITTQITHNLTNDFLEAFWNSKLFWRNKDGLYLGSFGQSDRFELKVSERSDEIAIKSFNISFKT